MKAFNKGISALLSTLIISSLLLSCGSESNIDKSPIEDSASGNDTSVSEEPKDYLDTLPVIDYGGASIRFAAAESVYYNNFPEESTNGEVVNDAMINRNEIIEERLNVTFENIAYADPGECANQVSTSILANEDAYDIVFADMATTAKRLILERQLIDYADIPYVDLSKEWWCKNNTDVTIGGKHYYPTAPFTPQYFDALYLILFNKNLAESYQVEDLLDLALQGKWTLDKMQAAMTDVAKDLNGDGKMNLKDQWALVYDDVAGYAFYFGVGGKMTEYDSEDFPYLDLGSEKVVSLIDRLCSVVGNKDNSLRGEKYEKHAEQPVFKEGRSLFAGQSILLVNSVYRDMGEDFGMLPMPKYDENQPDYYSYAQPWAATGAAIPITNSKIEATGLILETMAYISDTIIRDAVYETTHKGKYARDERVPKILDLIVDSACFDVNVYFDWGTTASRLRDAVLGNAKSYSSSYASVQKAADAAIAEFCALYRDSANSGE